MNKIPKRPTFNNHELFRPTITKFVAKHFKEEIEEDGGTLEDEGEVLVDTFIDVLPYANWDEEVITELIRHHDHEFSYSLWAIVQEFSGAMRKTLQELEQEWVKKHNIQPPFPIGTKIRYHGEEFIIDSISDHDTACYYLTNDALEARHPGAKKVTKFENVTPVKNEDNFNEH